MFFYKLFGIWLKNQHLCSCFSSLWFPVLFRFDAPRLNIRKILTYIPLPFSNLSSFLFMEVKTVSRIENKAGEAFFCQKMFSVSWAKFYASGMKSGMFNSKFMYLKTTIETFIKSFVPLFPHLLRHHIFSLQKPYLLRHLFLVVQSFKWEVTSWCSSSHPTNRIKFSYRLKIYHLHLLIYSKLLLFLQIVLTRLHTSKGFDIQMMLHAEA